MTLVSRDSLLNTSRFIDQSLFNQQNMRGSSCVELRRQVRSARRFRSDPTVVPGVSIPATIEGTCEFSGSRLQIHTLLSAVW